MPYSTEFLMSELVWQALTPDTRTSANTSERCPSPTLLPNMSHLETTQKAERIKDRIAGIWRSDSSDYVRILKLWNGKLGWA